jgi:hypothetical protein
MAQFRKNVVFAIIGVLGIVLCAQATPVTATITADNFYALYIGNSDGSNIKKIGRNEMDMFGNPMYDQNGNILWNWSQPETWKFDMAAGQEIFIAGWGDNSGLQGLIGQFDFGNTTVMTNKTDWMYTQLNYSLGNNMPEPTEAEMEAVLSADPSWQAIGSSANYGAIWGPIAGISSDAQWIWGDKIFSNAVNPNVEIFKMKPTSVPEPSLLQLLGMGLLCCTFAPRMIRKKQ